MSLAVHQAKTVLTREGAEDVDRSMAGAAALGLRPMLVVGLGDGDRLPVARNLDLTRQGLRWFHRRTVSRKPVRTEAAGLSWPISQVSAAVVWLSSSWTDLRLLHEGRVNSHHI